MDFTLPRDHSAWAKSVRWSCGRPGFKMPQDLFAAELADMDRLARVRSWAEAAMLSPDAPVKITDVTGA